MHGAAGRQWQAQLPPPCEPDDDDGALELPPSEDDDGVGAAAGAAGAAGAASPPATGATAGAGALPPLKSVAYQPDPFSWNPAAVTCFWNCSAPQAGHVVSTGSEIFCNTSREWPHEAQRYA